MLTNLLNRLNHEWLPSALAEPLTAIKAAGSKGQLRKINFLVFSHSSSQPVVLLKTVRERSQQDLLKQEYETLLTLYAHNSLRGHIPQPIGLFHHEDALIMVETCLPGISLENLLRRGKHYSRAEITGGMDRIQQWLIDFQHATIYGYRQFRGVEEIKERLTSSKTQLNPRLVDAIIALATEADGIEIPQTGRHGDFWAGNILMSKESIGIIDLETYSPSSSPLDDLFFFLVIHARKNFSNAFLKNTSLANRLAGLANSITKSLGISPRFTSLFFILFLLDMANGRIQLGRVGGESPPWHEYLAQIDSMDSLVMSR